MYLLHALNFPGKFESDFHHNGHCLKWFFLKNHLLNALDGKLRYIAQWKNCKTDTDDPLNLILVESLTKLSYVQKKCKLTGLTLSHTRIF